MTRSDTSRKDGMSVGSLFAGIGGFDIAAERVGMNLVWSAENDKHASKVLAHHWPDVPNLGDVHDVRDAPRVDVLTGGFPCQDYSVAGTRGGLAGDRGALWWQYLRLIAELRPAWVVGENVPGLLSSNDGADLETIVGSLTECGYGVAWAVLDAQYFGVAQRRRRVFIVGHSGGQPRPEVLALDEGVFGHPEPSRETGERTAPTLAARTRGGGWPGTDEALDGAVISSLTASHSYDQAGNEDWLVPTVAFSAGNHESSYGVGLSEEHTPPLRAGESGTNQVPTIAIQDTVRQSKEQSGRWWSDVDVAYTLDGQSGQGVAAFGENIRGEVLEADVVRSLNVGGGKPGQGYPAARVGTTVRRLTPLECERLQGFPDGHTDIPGNSDTQRYRQLGNAVAVPVAEWILRNVAASR